MPASGDDATAGMPDARRAWWAAVLMLGAVVVTPVLVGVLSLQIQDDLAMDNSQLGLCVTVFWLCTAVAAALGGRHADRLGWRRAAVIGCGLCLVGQLGIAASRSMATLFACLAVGGVAYGIVAPTSNLAVVREIPLRLRGTALGAKQSAAPVAGLVAGLAVPAVALTIGWRWAFVIIAVVAVLAAAASWPSGIQLTPTSPGATTVSARGRTTQSPAKPLSLPRVAVSAGLGTLSIGVLTTFSAQTLTRAGMSISAAGVVIAGCSVAALVVRLVAGWLTDRRSSDGLLPAAVMIAVGAVGMLMMATGGIALTVLGAVLAFCGGWGWPALLLLGVLTYHPARPAAASGRFQLGTALGAAVGPLVFAAVGEAAGFLTAWVVVAACTAASALLIALDAWGRRPGHAPAV